MIRFLIRAVIFLVTAAVGLAVAGWLVPGVRLEWGGFLIACVVFAIAQSILSPFVFNIARKYASALLGGIGLVSTFLALLIASVLPGGIHIAGVTAWVLATLVVWIVTALGGWLLPILFLKKRVVTAR